MPLDLNSVLRVYFWANKVNGEKMQKFPEGSDPPHILFRCDVEAFFGVQDGSYESNLLDNQNDEGAQRRWLPFSRKI